MPEKPEYWQFSIVSCTVCVPFFILIGSLNTHKGMNWWRTRTSDLIEQISIFFAWIASRGRRKEELPELSRTKSFESSAVGIRPLEPVLTMPADGMNKRQRRFSGNRKDSRGFDVTEEPLRRGDLERPENGVLRSPTLATPPAQPDSASNIASMWKKERRQRLRYSYTV